MEKMLGKLGVDFEYMLDGDIPDLSTEFIEKYFSGEMAVAAPVTSCASKHLLIFEKMMSENIPEALVFEDDIFLKKKFLWVLQKSREEMTALRERGNPYWVGFEASSLKIVPRSRRRKGQAAYLGNTVQCTGAYLLNLPMAKLIVDTAREEKISVPVDWYVDSIRSRGNDAFYWTYPVVAEQGSHISRMSSTISRQQKSRSRWLSRKCTVCYKHLVAFFR